MLSLVVFGFVPRIWEGVGFREIGKIWKQKPAGLETTPYEIKFSTPYEIKIPILNSNLLNGKI